MASRGSWIFRRPSPINGRRSGLPARRHNDARPARPCRKQTGLFVCRTGLSGSPRSSRRKTKFCARRLTPNWRPTSPILASLRCVTGSDRALSPGYVGDCQAGIKSSKNRESAWWRWQFQQTGLQSCAWKFPANRENNREFSQKWACFAKNAVQTTENSGRCAQIPYAAQQGINSRHQRIKIRAAGKRVDAAGRHSRRSRS